MANRGRTNSVGAKRCSDSEKGISFDPSEERNVVRRKLHVSWRGKSPDPVVSDVFAIPFGKAGRRDALVDAYLKEFREKLRRAEEKSGYQVEKLLELARD